MLIYILQMAGTAACASSGALSAGRKRLDVFGVLVVSFVAAIGGGTLRDLLLDRNPVFWMADSTYLHVSIVAGLLTWLYTLRWTPPLRLLLIVDAIGLALFTIAGVRISEQFGQPPVICVVMGIITGIVGGIVRDILCGEIPVTFRSELYASASALGGITYFLLQALQFKPDACALAGAIVIFLLRLAAMKWGWRLPVFELKENR